ncbi:MAG: hypothetical protein QXT14_02765 [Candidatus Bathyarchaeia archaeon]
MKDLYEMLKSKPGLADSLRRIIEWEKSNHGDRLGFEWWEVSADPRLLNSLVINGVLKVVLKTNKSTYYRVVDLNALESALSRLSEERLEVFEEALEIPRDLFDVIVGYEDVKDIVFRSLTSNSPTHILFFGEVSSAKSLFLEELARLPNSKFLLGSSLSKAGILDILFTYRPTYLIIDELDKVDDQDNTGCLLSLMERGYVVESKWGKQRSARLKTWVFAACNNLNRVSKELRSRFLVLKFREYTYDEFMDVSTNVLTKREGVSPAVAEVIAELVFRVLKSKDVRDCVKVARLISRNPTVEEARNVINLIALRNR